MQKKKKTNKTNKAHKYLIQYHAVNKSNGAKLKFCKTRNEVNKFYRLLIESLCTVATRCQTSIQSCELDRTFAYALFLS